MTNRLDNETSPYLLQHKDNPVDWYPWGDEALARARAEDKPILLSVGYAACHWCHVMEHESFEDEATASLMNANFVCIKVDREERPDIDAIYMDAVQAMTGHGGWPMTVFLTPDGIPFYGGTYFPKEDRHGLPSFKRLLDRISETWQGRRHEVEEQGRHLLEHIQASTSFEPSKELIGDQLLHDALRNLEKTFDPDYGGFGGAPKFPQPPAIDFLLRMIARGSEAAGTMADKTLLEMGRGGMFDQIGGGFARYSVDRRWIVPHFEKMLYDNAQLIRVYTRAWLARGQTRYQEVVTATVDWLLREMVDPGGGFWSSLDADSEGEEGKFYVWSLDEVHDATGPLADVAVATWGFSASGNFEGKNIPVLVDTEQDPDAVERARRDLLERREQRVRPATDDKVITSWNALTIAALAEAGVVFGRGDWIDAATRAMSFLLDTLRVDGRLMRSYRNGTVNHLAYCEDYAALLDAAITLFEVTGQPRWLDETRWSADEAIRLFHDPSSGGFYSTGSDAEQLVTRPRDIFDSPIPSPNSMVALEFQRLALITGYEAYAAYAVPPMRLGRDLVVRAPAGLSHLLCAIDFYTASPREIIIIGDPAEEPTKRLHQAVHRTYLPNRIVILAPEPDDPDDPPLPLLRGRTRRGGEAAAYVCRFGVCERPVTTPEDLAAQLAP